MVTVLCSRVREGEAKAKTGAEAISEAKAEEKGTTENSQERCKQSWCSYFY